MVKSISEREIAKLSFENKLSENDWKRISKRPVMSAAFVDKFWFMLDWNHVNKNVSKLRDCVFAHKANRDYWTNISNGDVSMKFVHKHRKLMNWKVLSRKRTFSSQFISSHKEYIVWDSLLITYKPEYFHLGILLYGDRYIEYTNRNLYDSMPYYLQENTSKVVKFVRDKSVFDGTERKYNCANSEKRELHSELTKKIQPH